MACSSSKEEFSACSETFSVELSLFCEDASFSDGCSACTGAFSVEPALLCEGSSFSDGCSACSETASADVVFSGSILFPYADCSCGSAAFGPAPVQPVKITSAEIIEAIIAALFLMLLLLRFSSSHSVRGSLKRIRSFIGAYPGPDSLCKLYIFASLLP